MYDNVDNPVKKFFRRPVVALAQNQAIWPKFREKGLGKVVYNLFSKIHIGLWDLSRSRLLREHKPSLISDAIDEAETECNNICENCGDEREKKGMDVGMALCNACGIPNQRR
jgi:hypothetical protein